MRECRASDLGENSKSGWVDLVFFEWWPSLGRIDGSMIQRVGPTRATIAHRRTLTAMLNLHVRTYGDGARPAIVMLHGLFGSSTNWGSVARQLAGRYFLLVPDLRNHGQSPHHPDSGYPAMVDDLLGLLDQHGLQPGLAVVIIGEDPASQVYVRNKGKRAESCGFYSVQHSLDADTSQEAVLELIDELNNDDRIHGILVQLPLPDHLDEQTITQSISPAKDVDGFHFINIGKLTSGNTADAFVPCTPAGCMLMIEDHLGADLSGLNAVVVGRSNIVGKPMAALLLQANATVTVCHSRTKDLAGVVRGACQ